jgi:hypothetical protein
MRHKTITLCPTTYEIARKMDNFSGWIRQELMKKQATQFKAKPEIREKYQAYCNPCDKSFLNTDPDLIKGIPCDECGKKTFYLGLIE